MWFNPEPLWALAPDGRFLHGVSDEYRILICTRDGELERIVTKSHQPRSVTAGDKEFVREKVGDFLAFRVPRFQFEQVVDGMAFADFYPAYFRIMSGPRNSLWVQRVRSPSDMSVEERDSFGFGAQSPQMFVFNPHLPFGAREWDVFDADGRYLGMVALPIRFDPVRFVGNLLYGIGRDELDVEYVVRLRVVEAGGES